MPIIKIHKMTKKINSISRVPTAGYPGGAISVKFKEKTTEHDPVFILQGIPLEDLADYNYCILYDKDGTTPLKYYWVDDKVYITNDIAEWHCHLDVLATYHDTILGAEGFCKYADKDHWNEFEDDDRLQPDNKISTANFPHKPNSRPSTAHQWVNDNYIAFDNGTFIGMDKAPLWTVMLTVFGTSTENPLPVPTTALQKFVMTFHTYQHIFETASSKAATIIDPLSQGDVYGALHNLFVTSFTGGSPADCVASVMYLPIPIGVYGPYGANWSEVDAIVLGGVPFDKPFDDEPIYSGNALNSYYTPNFYVPGYLPEVLLPLPALVNDIPFLRHPKYMKVTLTHPCGQVDISEIDYINSISIKLLQTYDIQSGSYVTKILEANDKGSRAIAEVNGTLNQDIGWIAEGSKNNALENVFSNASATSLSTALIPLMSAGGQSTTITPGDMTTKIVNEETAPSAILNSTGTGPIRGAGTAKSTTRSSGPTTTSSKSYNNSGIQGMFPKPKSLTPTRETQRGSSLINVVTANDNDGGSNFLQWTIWVELYLPSIFMDPQNDTMIAQDAEQRYEAFCNQYGWVCNKRLRLGEIFDEDNQPTKTSYVQMVGASWRPETSSTTTSSIKHEPAASSNDICEVNRFLNTGIYLER